MKPKILLFCLSVCAAGAQTPFTVGDICVARGESEAVLAAVRDLQKDIADVTGRRPSIAGESRPGCILVGTATNPNARPLLEAAGVRVAALDGKWENFVLRLSGSKTLAIGGSNDLGTVFGIYDFAGRCLGIDPIANWTGLPPARKPRVEISALDVSSGTPTFRFRGWFLNDEDLITGWHLSPERRRLVHYYFHRPIADDVYEKVFETALRLKSNLIIPGSYIDLESAVDRKIVDAAVRRGLFVSQHHTQPLGVSAFAFRNYWHDRGKKVEFSYTSRAGEMEEVWRHYAKLWARYPKVVWQLGLRGNSDRPFWMADTKAPSTDAERGAVISGAIRKQWEIVRETTRGSSPLATATLWAEGSPLHQKGALTFPEGVAVVFADEGATQEMQQDFREVRREKGRGYGVYYHAAFWGAGPRLAQGLTLEKMARNYTAVVGKGDTFLSVLNVGSIREVVLQVEAVADITWRNEGFDAGRYLRRWCGREFGKEVAEEAAGQYEKYFAAFAPGSKALMLDGVIRAAGKEILTQALDRDSFPAGGSPALSARLRGHAERAAKSAAAFRQAADGARSLLPHIPEARRQFFADNLLVQAETMWGLSVWLDELARGMLAFTNLEVAESARRAERAGAALGHVLEFRKQAEWGIWENWYRGDWRMNLPALREDTGEVARKWAELAVLESRQ
jgi:hypothetical protein